jgi:hypothetical protein
MSIGAKARPRAKYHQQEYAAVAANDLYCLPLPGLVLTPQGQHKSLHPDQLSQTLANFDSI